MASTIKLKNGSGAPTAGDLVQGEPALDLTNKRLYTEDSGGTVLEIGTNPTSVTTGTFTSTGIDDNATSTAITIDSSENVGIGTSSPAVKTHIYSTGTNETLRLEGGTTALGCQINFKNPHNSLMYVGIAGDSTGDSIYYNGASSNSIFYTNGSERMRIDSSGNLLVGKTTTTVTTGCDMRPTGNIVASASADNPLYLNRSTNDGDIAVFAKDGTAVGSIGVNAGSIAFGQSNTAIGAFNTDRILFPATASGGVQDNAIDLGYSNGRFKDLYLSGGVYLGGTGSANHLDDYEEGTFTLSASAGTLTYLYGTSSTYTKIGNRVIIDLGQLQITGVPNNSSVFVLTGLPFTTQGQSGIPTAFVNTQFGTSSAFQWFNMYVESNQIYISKRNTSYLLTNADITGGTYQFSAGGSAYRTT